MSTRIFPDDVLFLQRLLKAEGLYKKELDGEWGKFTEKAAVEFERRSEEIRVATRLFDSRSESHIRTLALRAQKEARVFLGKVLDAGINARIISGTRTYAEQDSLYRQGRFGNPGPTVTKARGGQSNHNFGIAWDIGIFTKTGGYITEGDAYDKVAKVGMSDSIEWGGNWAGFVDKPHYQLKVELSIAQVRGRFEAGESFTMLA